MEVIRTSDHLKDRLDRFNSKYKAITAAADKMICLDFVNKNEKKEREKKFQIFESLDLAANIEYFYIHVHDSQKKFAIFHKAGGEDGEPKEMKIEIKE